MVNVKYYRGWINKEFNEFYSLCENYSRNKYAMLSYDYNKLVMVLTLDYEFYYVFVAGNINIMDNLLPKISSMDYNFNIIEKEINNIDIPDIEPIEHLQLFQDYTGLSKQDYNHRVEIVNSLEEMLETLDGNETENARQIAEEIYDKYFKGKPIKNKKDLIDSHLDNVVYNLGSVIKLGFDPKCALSEVAKHINTRRGKIINGKFTKSKKPEDIKYWHKPDFNRCIKDRE